MLRPNLNNLNRVAEPPITGSNCTHEKLIQISTDEVYGSIEIGSWTEKSPLQPNSPYSASKAGGELLARTYFKTHGIDVVITESTYGDRLHDAPPESFAIELNAAFKRGGTVLIPAFAVDRTEVILLKLRELIDAKIISNVPIYVDSPMALAALNYYREAVSTESPEIRPGAHEKWHDQDPFDTGKLFQAQTTAESIAINDVTGNAIIVSASGMATGGRVVHHLQQFPYRQHVHRHNQHHQ